MKAQSNTKAWTPSSLARIAATRKFDFSLSFNKEDNDCWYVDIPYPFSHANLQMVAGADLFLEALARGERRVTVRFCDQPFEGYEHEWHSAHEGESYGCTYRTVSPIYEGKTWLCPVTLYVLGHYPEHIYIQQL